MDANTTPFYVMDRSICGFRYLQEVGYSGMTVFIFPPVNFLALLFRNINPPGQTSYLSSSPCALTVQNSACYTLNKHIFGGMNK